jgi:hypothetical protein
MGTSVFTPSPFPASAGAFYARVIWRPGVPSSGNVFATWAEIETIIAATQGSVIVAVDPSVATAVIPATASTECFGRVILTGYTLNISSGAPISIADGGQLKNLFTVQSIGIEGVTTIRPYLLQNITGGVLLLREGGNLTMLAGSTVPAVNLNGSFSQIALFLGASLNNATGNPALAMVQLAPGVGMIFATLALAGNSGPPQYQDNLFAGDATTQMILVFDASGAPVVQPNFLGIVQPTPVDWAAGLRYNDGLVGVNYGNDYVQPALDRCKQLLAGSGSTPARPAFADVSVGAMYFDTDLVPPRPIFSKGTDWVDATGTVV